jgi:hypothetical protein
MVGKRTFPRHATRFVALLPFVPMFAAACGGSDYLPVGDDDAGPDATPLGDGSMLLDGRANETGADAMGDGTVGDASPGDAADASDGAASDGDASEGDASDAGLEDASDAAPLDAAGDGSGVSDAAEDASDASDAAVEDASDAAIEDASDAADGSGDSGGVMNILGRATSFAVFGEATVTNAGSTTVDGDLGSSSSTAITATNPTIIAPYAEHLGDSAATAALADIEIAYNDLIPGNLPGCALLPADVGGMTLTPGIYCFSSTAAITGILTLDAQSNPNAVWVFQVASALTINTGSSVVIKPGSGTAGQVCNSYWQVTSAASLNTGTVFGGNILANAAISLGTGVTVLGRVYSWNGGVTMLANTVDITGCATSVPVP